MGPSDDAAAQRELNATLERFRGDARVALGLRPTDDAAAARRAFMALCKVYHPAKFARFSASTVRLSNEVFLAIRRAYESIGAAAPAPAAPTLSAPTLSSAPTPRAATTPPPERPSGALPRIVRFTPPTGVPVTPAPPITTPPPHRAPSPRPASPSPAPPLPRAPTARPASPSPAPSVRAAGNVQLERALTLAQQEKWSEARAAFVDLATRHPGDPRYRAYVHYARGWEAFSLGKDAEARAEWQRALACDPRNDLAKWALESTGVVK